MFNTTANFISTELQTLLQNQWILIANWKWLALVCTTFLILFLNKFSRIVIFRIKKSFHFSDPRSFIAYFVQQDIEKGLSWIFASIVGLVIVENLELTTKLEHYLIILLKVTALLHLLRLAYFAAEASGLLIQNFAMKSSSPISDQISPLATKTLKVLVIIIGSLMILQNLGAEVTPILAGLGLGGMALAFAAQDTVANVFGTVTILLDTPFKIGDHVKIAEVEGKVEEVGFRSTRIRTFSNTLVTLSNSFVAKEKIENFNERRGLCRFRHILGFSYASTPESIELFCQHLHEALQQESTVEKDKTVIQVHAFADSSINILVNFHFMADEIQTETAQTQRFLLGIYKVAASCKLDFAFPTRTIILENKA